MALIKTLSNQTARLKVFGIGGGGNNAVGRMFVDGQIPGVDLIAVNTDSQALLQSPVQIKLQIGEKLTRGLGSGGNPTTGKNAAEESKDRILELLEGTDMLFITGGMGGGTCTGAAPVIAQLAHSQGILTVAILTKPFFFEGTKRQAIAEEGLRQLGDKLDTLIIVPNQKILEFTDKKLTLENAFQLADSTLIRGVQAIAQLITRPGLINLDFADIRAVMKNAGTALMAVGQGEGEKRAQNALQSALSSPFIDLDVRGARGILLNISGGHDLTMAETEEIANHITQSAEADANIIFGTNIDPSLKGKINITLIATGFSNQNNRKSASITGPLPVNVSLNDRLSRPDITENNPTTDKIDSPSLKLLKDHLIPDGIEIESDLDVPSFLRQN